MKEKLLGALIGLARATEGNEELITADTDKIMLEGLTATLPDSTLSDEALEHLYDQVMLEKQRIIPSCFTCTTPCGRTDNYNMQELWDMDEDIRSLKLTLLSGVQNLALRKKLDKDTTLYIYKALILFGIYWDVEGMVPILKELEDVICRNVQI